MFDVPVIVWFRQVWRNCERMDFVSFWSTGERADFVSSVIVWFRQFLAYL